MTYIKEVSCDESDSFKICPKPCPRWKLVKLDDWSNATGRRYGQGSVRDLQFVIYLLYNQYLDSKMAFTRGFIDIHPPTYTDIWPNCDISDAA